MSRPVIIATRGSPLALAQARFILNACKAGLPENVFQISIIKTTGDRMQTENLGPENLAKGLFTREIEMALLDGTADLAVHSLKDLPTELPPGLSLAAIPRREDARDLLIFKKVAAQFPDETAAKLLRAGVTVGTNSNRRIRQLKLLRPDLQIAPLRGNVGTRLKKLAEGNEMSAIVLAAAGLSRLGFTIDGAGGLHGAELPDSLRGVVIPIGQMVPCPGQAALGIETIIGHPLAPLLRQALNHASTEAAVTCERAFLRALGGGCQTPVGAYAEVTGDRLNLRVFADREPVPYRRTVEGSIDGAEALGREAALEML